MAELKARTADLTWREVDDEIVILDLTGSQYYSLNGAAAELWKLMIDTPTTPSALAQHLVADYSISAAQAEADVTDFLSQCRALGVLDE